MIFQHFYLKFINRLRKFIPNVLWPPFWLVLPVSAIAVLPIGLPSLEWLAHIGLDEAPRLEQLLMLASIIYGFAVGVFVLIYIPGAGLRPRTASMASWLGGISVGFPITFLLVLFQIFGRP